MAKKKKKTGKTITQLFGTVFKWVFFILLRCIPVVLIIALLLYVFITAKKYLYSDPNFIITNLHITTDHYYPKEEVAKRGNIQSGARIFTVDINRIAESLEQDPRVKKAKVRKVFPNALDITLMIREAYAYLSFAEEKAFFVIDREGYAISACEENECEAQYPVIIDGATVRKRIGLGTQHFTGNISNAFFVIEYLRNDGYYASLEVKRTVIDRLNSISLIVGESGLEIKLGNKRLLDNMQKLSHLEKVLEGENKAKIKYIDLRFDDIIVKK
ncbi:MAG: FtsQ-type POTRA domain-containing protein [Candidatus Omnitrophica bacterium]|nr:FtsQ-type POTRA domain-containing protein [Candidatus Omnitrophota bacterium]